jgi:hypothetical protein
MPVTFNFEYDGVAGINPGETITVGWVLFAGEFPPLIDHGQILRGGPGRHFVQVRTMDQEGESAGFSRAFFYTVRNLDSAFIYTGYNYIFPKVT